MISYLPPDLLSQIFLSLPVRSIVRCACVCKFWYNLIKDSNFVTTHLRKTLDSIKNNTDHDYQLLFGCGIFDSRKRYPLYIDKGEELKEYMKLNLPNFTSSHKGIVVLGSCNGLICLMDSCDRNTFILWNPMIEKVLNVSKLNLYEHDSSYESMVGFGFDYHSNDYKILRILQDRCRRACPRIQLFSVKKGHWINVTLNVPKIQIVGDSSLAFVNGIVHCIGFWELGNEIFSNVILGFDVSKHVFFKIVLPPSLQNGSPFNLSITGYKDMSIAVDEWNIFGYQIWMMKEYGTVESWTKLKIVDEITNSKKVLGFRRNGEVLFGGYEEGIVSFDLESKQVKNHGIRRELCISVGSYIESLALLDIDTVQDSKKRKRRKDEVDVIGRAEQFIESFGC